MLVNGWTIMGRMCSSYDYTMGFGVSARVAQKSTRLSVTPPHGISNKINQLIKKSVSCLCYFCAYKSNQKTSDNSPERFLSIATASAELAGDMSARSNMRRKLLEATDLILKNLIVRAHNVRVKKFGLVDLISPNPVDLFRVWDCETNRNSDRQNGWQRFIVRQLSGALVACKSGAASVVLAEACLANIPMTFGYFWSCKSNKINSLKLREEVGYGC